MENTFRTSTSNVPEYKNSFNHLKEFSLFLAENLEQVSGHHLDLLVKHNFPLSTLFNTDDKKEILDFVRQDLKEFLENIQESQIVEKELQRLKKQKTATIPELENIGVKSGQIDLKLSLVRKTFLKFLPDYTQEVKEFQSVLTELEDICYYLNEQDSF